MATSYNIGTASFTAGSRDVTGQGVNWTAAGIRADDLFWADGLLVRVEALISNTQLRLAYPWPGQSRTGSAYEVQFSSDFSRAVGASSTALSGLSAPSLAAIRALTPSTNRIPYFTGGLTAALATLTGKGREIISAQSNAEVQSRIGITTQADAFDAEVGKFLRTGAFGLGSTTGVDVTNIDNVNQPTSFFTVTPVDVSGTLPATVGARDGVLHFKIGSSIAVQIYFSSHSTSPMYIRRSTGTTTWQAWKLIATE